MSNSNTKQWYVIYVRPQFEKKVLRSSNEKGIEAYLPLKQVVKQWHDRKKKLAVPVFPGYVFVRITAFERPQIYAINGFVKFVCTGGIPDVITESRMNMLKKVLNGEFDVGEISFRNGERVKLLSGPLSGLEGVLVSHKGSKRIAVKVEEINHYIIINVNASALIKVENSKNVA
ncbi:UpxY family transcription antiterminator [Fulvivirga kasyanovii]|uniref:UpxY family transcription antiterminator n=1 Tax=Fulvivirga kasyanovii TaxID=396812 RepID=A0ABW9RU91_9BACT|nr:UpxY family transcription antiterminator [Fulvivirga kasyanovii]MTI27631.1 UpxY family transcription antiterminator [Fulvivirga kasyanovii]